MVEFQTRDDMEDVLDQLDDTVTQGEGVRVRAMLLGMAMMTFSECECGDDLGDTCECGDDTRGDEGHLHARSMCSCVELGALITSPLRLCAHIDMSPRLRMLFCFTGIQESLRRQKLRPRQEGRWWSFS